MSLPIRKKSNHGKPCFQVNLGKRLTGLSRYQRKFFPTFRAAKKFAKEFLDQKDESSHFLVSLSSAHRIGLVALYRLLEDKGMSVDAAQDIISRLEVAKDGTEQISGSGIKVDKAVNEFLANRIALNLDPDTIREYRSHLSRFVKAFAIRELVTIEKKEIEAWLNGMTIKPRTRRNYVTSLRTFFGYWVDEEVLQKSSADRVPKPKIKRTRPDILTLDHIARFLELVCREIPDLIAPLAFSLFAGIRTKEVFRLLWSDVNLETGIFDVPEQAGKGDRERSFPITPQLRTWLEFCPNRTGRVFKFRSLCEYWRTRKKAALKAGIGKIPRNSLRKSFSSFTWSIDRDTKALAAQLGNSPTIAKRFYLATVSAKEGEKYKTITPITGKAQPSDKDGHV